MRSEMEMERMKQMHLKELEDKEEELDDVHKSSQRRVRKPAPLPSQRSPFTPPGVSGISHCEPFHTIAM